MLDALSGPGSDAGLAGMAMTDDDWVGYNVTSRAFRAKPRCPFL